MKNSVNSSGRFLGWYVDGEWKVENGMITFLEFKERSGLATNNLVMKSPRIEFIFDFKVDFQPKTQGTANPRIQETEVIVFSISPEIYDIKSFDAQQTVMHAYGLTLFMFRAKDGKSVLFVREFNTPTMYNTREIFQEYEKETNKPGCDIDYLNKNVFLNVTMDFDSATLRVSVNDKSCVDHKISNTVFPQQRATTTFFAYSSEKGPIRVTFSEVSIYKAVSLLSSQQAALTASVHGLVQQVNKYDPLHFKNASLSNILLMDVSLAGKVGKDTGAHAGSNGADGHSFRQSR